MVVLFDTGFCSTAIGPTEVFYYAGLLWNRFRGEPEYPRFNVRVASLDGKPVGSLYGVSLTPHCGIDADPAPDLIVLMAVDPHGYRPMLASGVLLPWLRAAHERGAWIAGICGGVALLAEAGLLEGKRATTHWAVADVLRERFPKVVWQPEHFVTEDGRVLCSGGVYASIDLSLYLVEKFCGHDIALQCAKSLLVSLPRNLQSGYGVLPLSRPHADDSVRRAEDFLQRHFERNVLLEEVATQLGMSPRNLLRRFKAATGLLPGEYLQRLRVNAARDLLERGRAPLQKIASAVGYDDVASFRSLFKRHLGMTPAEYRTRFGPLAVARGELQAG
jgi:transcriptional regulator GlxA family with amidase domain